MLYACVTWCSSCCSSMWRLASKVLKKCKSFESFAELIVLSAHIDDVLFMVLGISC